MAASTINSIFCFTKIALGDGRVANARVKNVNEVRWIQMNLKDVISSILLSYPPGQPLPEPLDLVLPPMPEAETSQRLSAKMIEATSTPAPLQSTSTSLDAGRPQSGLKKSTVPLGCTVSAASATLSAPPPSGLRHEWTSNQTKRLISLIDDRLEDLKSAKNKQPIWNEIAAKFNCHTITAHKCEDKWKNLKKAYRDHVQKNNRTGSAPSKFEYGEEMSKVMGDDPSVFPKMTIASDCKVGGTAAVVNEALEIDMEDAAMDAETSIASCSKGNSMPETSTSSTTSRRKTTKRKSTGIEEVLDYIKEKDDKMMQQMHQMHEDNLKVMNRIADKL